MLMSYFGIPGFTQNVILTCTDMNN